MSFHVEMRRIEEAPFNYGGEPVNLLQLNHRTAEQNMYRIQMYPKTRPSRKGRKAANNESIANPA